MHVIVSLHNALLHRMYFWPLSLIWALILRSFRSLWYTLYFCAALSKQLVFQVLDKSDTEVSLKQEKKELSLMKKGKKKFSLPILVATELFSSMTYVAYLMRDVVQKFGSSLDF